MLMIMVGRRVCERRFHCDFRQLNNGTIKDAYSFPGVVENIFHLVDAKCFTSLDLAITIWQFPMNEKDLIKHSFGSKVGIFLLEAHVRRTVKLS